MKKFLNILISLHPYLKKTVTIMLDITLCFVCTWLSFLIKLDEPIAFQDFNYNFAFTSVIIAIPVFWLSGLYNTILRYADRSILSVITSSIFTYAILFYLTINISNIQSHSARNKHNRFMRLKFLLSTVATSTRGSSFATAMALTLASLMWLAPAKSTTTSTTSILALNQPALLRRRASGFRVPSLLASLTETLVPSKRRPSRPKRTVGGSSIPENAKVNQETFPFSK